MQYINILIVDDIVVNRLLLKEIIKQIGHKYFEAGNGKEAIQIIKSEKIDLIMMDIEMPVMNGLETTKYIRKELNSPLRNIPIIALTAYNPNDFFENFKDIGFNELICKPYLVEKISNTLAKFF